MASDKTTKIAVVLKDTKHAMRFVEDGPHSLLVGIDGVTIPVDLDRMVASQELEDRFEHEDDSWEEGAESKVVSPIPGVVTAVLVKPGDEVQSGQPLCQILAMKMENEITSSRTGIIKMVAVQAGQSVMTDHLLFEYA